MIILFLEETKNCKCEIIWKINIDLAHNPYGALNLLAALLSLFKCLFTISIWWNLEHAQPGKSPIMDRHSCLVAICFIHPPLLFEILYFAYENKFSFNDYINSIYCFIFRHKTLSVRMGRWPVGENVKEVEIAVRREWWLYQEGLEDWWHFRVRVAMLCMELARLSVRSTENGLPHPQYARVWGHISNIQLNLFQCCSYCFNK